jgi:hypothetical protein
MTKSEQHPYWKVRMLRQRSLACRNYICAKMWRIISLKIWMFSFTRGVTAWMTHMYHILGQLELERMKSWNSRTHVNEKFSRYNIYMFHFLLLMLWCFSTYRYKCFDSFVFNMETPSSTESGAWTDNLIFKLCGQHNFIIYLWAEYVHV